MILYGKNRQVCFKNKKEEKIAIDYILNSENVNYNIHENNQEQGAWGSEDRIHFKNKQGVPACLIRNMTAGRRGLYGRINCKELCQKIRKSKKNN